jgi:hypothetical protein
MDPGVYVAKDSRITIHEVAWPLAIYSRDGGGRKVSLSTSLSKMLSEGGYTRRRHR